ncbi:hypothetical protein FOL47_009577 [Perkinsus chesapeaki]|uniref:Uncharacterized protein n=1 Tax=Perkinsus chesapeaki TaxID=330153 RepID=A0A7J6MTD9_PERCH|nr:hypothetical protein FOL47_009577 [Perkinsus chesapeaki]
MKSSPCGTFSAIVGFCSESITWESPVGPAMATRERLSARVAADLAAAQQHQTSSAVSPKRRRVDSPNRRHLTRAHTGPVFPAEGRAAPGLTRVHTVTGGRLPVTQPRLRHGIKDVSIGNAADIQPANDDKENVALKGNRSSLESADSVYLSNDKEEVNLADSVVEEDYPTQWQEEELLLEEDQQDSPSPILYQHMSPDQPTYSTTGPPNFVAQQERAMGSSASARSVAPTVDLASRPSEPPNWNEYSFANYDPRPTPASVIGNRERNAALDDELSQTQWQPTQEAGPTPSFSSTTRQHTSPEFGYRPYGASQGPPPPPPVSARSYQPPAPPTVSNAPLSGGSEGTWQTRPDSGVSYPSLNPRVMEPSAPSHRGITELEGYASDNSGRWNPTTPIQTQETASDSPVEGSARSYTSFYASMLSDVAARNAREVPQSSGPMMDCVQRGQRHNEPVKSAEMLQSVDYGIADGLAVAGLANRPPGRDKLSNILLSKGLLRIEQIAEDLKKILHNRLPGDAYDHHLYAEAFTRIVDAVRKLYFEGAGRVSLSASHQALLSFADNMIVAWRGESILGISTKCMLLRQQARLELCYRGLIRPSKASVENATRRVEALKASIATKQALLEKLRREKGTQLQGNKEVSTEEMIERKVALLKEASGGTEETPALVPSYDLLFELGDRWITMEFITEEERTRGLWEDPGDDFEAFNVPTAMTPDLADVEIEESAEEGEGLDRRRRRARESVGSNASMMAMDCGMEDFTCC